MAAKGSRREPQSERVELKMAKTLKAKVEARAAAQGKTVSQWIRDVIMAALRQAD